MYRSYLTVLSTHLTNAANLDKIYWNEKITFEFPASEMETLSHLKLKIVNEEFFTDDEFVGETM